MERLHYRTNFFRRTGVFLCRQSELFLAFRINNSYSRIVDKKTRPKASSFNRSLFRLFSRLVLKMEVIHSAHTALTCYVCIPDYPIALDSYPMH